MGALWALSPFSFVLPGKWGMVVHVLAGVLVIVLTLRSILRDSAKKNGLMWRAFQKVKKRRK